MFSVCLQEKTIQGHLMNMTAFPLNAMESMCIQKEHKQEHEVFPIKFPFS